MTTTAVAPRQQTAPLARPVTSLRGVGPERAQQLACLDIRTIEDLLLHRPRRYENRAQFRPICELQIGEAALTRGKVVALGVKWFRYRAKSIFELILDDGSGRLHCRWWNLPFMEKYFAAGDEVVVFGKVLALKPRTMDHPETEVVELGEENFIHLNRITPIYPLTEGLPQRWLRSLIWRTLSEFESRIADPSILPRTPRDDAAGSSAAKRRQSEPEFLSRPQAIRKLHFPDSLEDIDSARRRLALDEFIDLQRQIQTRRRNLEIKAPAMPSGGNNRLIKPFLAHLGFRLTDAQTKVLRQIRNDLAGPRPMRRLLQGDVGAGKTVVAACSALMAVESGRTVALMAPTEVLAEQHYRNFRKWFEPLGIVVEIRTGSRKSPNPRGTPEQQPEPARLVIGTHALITAGFELPNLGLVIIDEQHKFGVTQREELLRKGRYPHLLVMTATPIPRTLGLTLYGELDSSVIDEMPAGRGKIQTFVRTADRLPKVWKFVLEKLATGRQAYVVYPRVEETGEGGTKAVTKEFEQLQKALSPFRVGMMHGRMKSHEKEAVMDAFRKNSLQVLLATSLIEVGVDVPNATVMLVENAEQFGLAQLHQLRGRIGRGAHDSYCILVAGAKNKEACQRLEILEETSDGFKIAEADLKIRGAGELLGQQQSGMPNFRFGNLNTDLDLILRARQEAARALNSTA
jgi:ATP-dependent DNA helicase RecG